MSSQAPEPPNLRNLLLLKKAEGRSERNVKIRIDQHMAFAIFTAHLGSGQSVEMSTEDLSIEKKKNSIDLSRD